MKTKTKILRIINDHNNEDSVSFPIIDRKMTQEGIFGTSLKSLIDSYVEEGLLIWVGSLSLKITEQGKFFLTLSEKNSENIEN